MDGMRCDRCGGVAVKVWFTEKETVRGIPTGRERLAVSHLECDDCGKHFVVDDSMDMPWRNKQIRR